LSRAAILLRKSAARVEASSRYDACLGVSATSSDCPVPVTGSRLSDAGGEGGKESVEDRALVRVEAGVEGGDDSGDQRAEKGFSELVCSLGHDQQGASAVAGVAVSGDQAACRQPVDEGGGRG